MTVLDLALAAFTKAAEHITGECPGCRPEWRLPQMCPDGQALAAEALGVLFVVPPADPFGPAASAYLVESSREAVAAELVQFADLMEAHRPDATRDAWWVRYGARIARDGLAAHLLAVRTQEQQEYLAELDRLREGALVAEADRDAAQDWADTLAYKVAPVEVLGRREDGRFPWGDALEMLTPAAEVTRLRTALDEAVVDGERLAALLELRAEQGAVVTVPAAEVWRLREELTRAREEAASLRGRVNELVEQRDDALLDIATAPEPDPARQARGDEARMAELEDERRQLLALLPQEPCITQGIPNQLAAAEAEWSAFQQVADILGVALPYGPTPSEAREAGAVFQAPGVHDHWSWKCPKESGGCGYASPFLIEQEAAALVAYREHLTTCGSNGDR